MDAIPVIRAPDHTREHTPLLVWGKEIRQGVNLGTRETYSDISATVLEFFGIQNTLRGTSFLSEIRPS